MKINIANFIFLIASLVFCTVIFSRIKPHQFLLVHDQATWISPQHLSGGSFIRLPDNGGITLGVQTAMGLPNQTIYSLLFGLGLSARNVQSVVFVICLYLFLSISFYAFYKISDCWNKLTYDRSDFFNAFVATLFYCLGFLSILYINSGGFWSLDFVLAYSFFPLIFYYVIEFVESGTLSNREAILFAFALAVSANHAVFLIPMVVGVLVFLLSKYSLKDYLKINIKKIFFVLVLFFLLSSHLWIMYVFEARYNTGNFIETALGGSTAGSIRGGFLYQFLNYFSWALYSPWKPRSILTFDKYFLSHLYTTVFLSIYAVILFFLVKNKNLIKKALPFLSVLLVSAFLGKGPQPPLGFIYNYLVTHFSFPFVAVRSPDSKFALGIVFAIAVLILLILQSCKGKKYAPLFRVYFLAVVIVASYPLITGEAVLGKDTPDQSGSFVTEVFPEYQEALNILNQDDEMSSVLVQPAQVMLCLIHDGKIFIGQDVLRAESKKPFLYSSSALTNANLFSRLSGIYEGFDLRGVEDLNVRYIIIRKDVCRDSDRRGVDKFREELTKSNISRRLIDNDYLELYEVKDDYFLPHFYVPRSTVYANSGIEGLVDVREFEEDELRTGVYLENPNLENRGILGRSDEVFVAGKRVGSVLESLGLEEEEWVWPEAGVEPGSRKYPLVRLKEWWVEKRARGSLDKADVLLWHGVKRIREIVKWDVKDTKLLDMGVISYKEKVGEAMRILKTIPEGGRGEEFWEMVAEVLAYTDKVEGEVGDIGEIEKLHRGFKEWVAATPENWCRGGYCYEVSVPEAGKYKIFVEAGNVTAEEIKMGDEILTPARNLGEGGWISFGEMEFEEGTPRLELDLSGFEDVAASRVSAPRVVLGKLGNLETTEVPKITFVKVNPTKYRVKVEGAKEPYTLVLSESFHQGWGVYAKNFQFSNPNFQNGYGNVVASYFDGDIEEGTHRDVFLEPATFETWGEGPIDADHLTVNGYANSWYIEPEDVGGVEDYELIVEFWPQRLFYMGLFVSGLTLAGCLGYLGYDLARRWR